VFGKHALRTKYCVFFSLIKIELAKPDLKLMDSAQSRGLSFLTQNPSLKTQSKNINKKIKIK
jgi:hypothetical protein